MLSEIWSLLTVLTESGHLGPVPDLSHDGAMVIIVNGAGEVLLMLRDDRPDVVHAGQWSIVGGRIEPGETATAAVVREVQEEIGAAIEPRYLGDAVDADGRGDVIAIFVAALDEPVSRLRLGEGQEIRFFPPPELDALDIPEFARGSLRTFLSLPDHARRRLLEGSRGARQ